jgi:hypothetical protein
VPSGKTGKSIFRCQVAKAAEAKWWQELLELMQASGDDCNGPLERVLRGLMVD